MTASTQRPDEQRALLSAIAEGNNVAWQEVMDRYEPAVRGALAGFRFDRSTADDVAQNVWIKLYECAGDIRDPKCLGGWLRTTTRRMAIDVTRKRKRVVPVEDFSGLEELWFDDPDPGPGWQERAALCSGFRALSDDSQELLSLVFADEPLPYAEIAERVKRPVGSLGPTRARALDKLRTNYVAELSKAAAA